MFPGGMNPKQMKQMLSRFGIKAEEVKAVRVIIQTQEKNIVVEEPEVMKMVVPGQGQMYSISGGKTREEEASKPSMEEEISVEISDEDVKIVSEQAGVDAGEARKALTETGGDIAAAIMKLKG